MCPFCVTGHVRSNSERKREEKKKWEEKVNGLSAGDRWKEAGERQEGVRCEGR